MSWVNSTLNQVVCPVQVGTAGVIIGFPGHTTHRTKFSGRTAHDQQEK